MCRRISTCHTTLRLKTPANTQSTKHSLQFFSDKRLCLYNTYNWFPIPNATKNSVNIFSLHGNCRLISGVLSINFHGNNRVSMSNKPTARQRHRIAFLFFICDRSPSITSNRKIPSSAKETDSLPLTIPSIVIISSCVSNAGFVLT